MPAPLGQAPGSREPVSQEPPVSDSAGSGYSVVATPDTTAAFEPVARSEETAAAKDESRPAEATSAVAENSNVGLAATPTHMLLLLAGALAVAGILVHATFRIVAARRRRILVDKGEVVWESAYDRPGPNPGVPANEAYPHDDVEKTLREILRACGHRAA